MEQSIDYDQALLDPASVFATPEEVVEHAGLSTAQKVEILRRWEYDASELEVAEEEGMGGGTSTMLRRVLLALDRLTGDGDVTHAAPTKQNGS